MKTTLRVIAVAVFACALGLLPVAAHADAQDFSFASFDADYTLSRDAQYIGHIHVVEHLEAVFPDFDQNHGIIRAIPDTYDGHSVHLKVSSVTDGSGVAVPHSDSTSNHNLELKIGRADAYVRGHQTYVITYDMDNVTAKPTGYDGLFWDVNGDQWSQPFAKVTARVHVDPSLASARDSTHDRCFAGARGSQEQNCTIETGGDGTVVANATDLTAGQTLTYELGFASGTFAAYTRPPSEIITFAAKILFFIVLPVGLALWFGLRRWWRYGRDPAGRGTVIAEYTPPKGLSVLEASAVFHEGYDSAAITAAILDLAVRGYLKIYEIKKSRPLLPDSTSYQLELTGDPAKLKPEEQKVLNMIFGDTVSHPRVDISTLKNKLYSQADQIGAFVTQSVTDAGYLASGPQNSKTTYLLPAVLAFFIGLVCLYFQPLLAGGLEAAAFILFCVGQFMPARTAKGVEVLDILRGLKLFITMAEADRIKAMQSPHGALTEKVDTTDHAQLIKLYEKLLPYAMLFGIEKDWIKEFAGLYKEPPDWYQRSGAFNAGYFVGAMSSFTTASNAGFTPPSSSGSGGSAGGGGGGGGGGGW